MAKQTQTFITDDIDGSKDASEIGFSFKGTDYTIDLSKKNLGAMEKALKPYLDVATKVSRKSATKRASSSGTGRGDLAAVRAWAAEQGIEVSERGRVAKAVVDAYDAAQ